MKKLRWMFLLTWLVPYCHAEVLVNQYLNEKNKYMQEAYKMYVVGLGEAFSWANTELQGRGLPPLYCVTPGLPMNGNTYVNLLDLQIEDMRKWKEWPQIKAWPMPMALLVALKQTFPCQAPEAPGK